MHDIYWLKIFTWIDEHIVNVIISNAKIEKFNAGDIILEEWDESNGKGYIIKNGDVIVEIWGNKIAELWVWEIFWEIGLLSEDQRMATIKAVWHVETIILSQDDLVEMINNGNESINKDLIERIEKNLTHNY